ncbi:MAG: hypothetical protein M3340_07650 [Actinomycetota bacterium]|nr:hypothetical protein [Actinomycetota bacterium]
MAAEPPSHEVPGAASAVVIDPDREAPAGLEGRVVGEQAFRVRFRVALTVIPPLAGIVTAIPLWTAHAEKDFFSAASHVLAIGGVALVIQGRFFRLRPHVTGQPADLYAILNLITVLVSIGVGLAFSFRALAYGEARTPDFPLVAASLSTAVAAFAVLALFGNPGEVEEGDVEE